MTPRSAAIAAALLLQACGHPQPSPPTPPTEAAAEPTDRQRADDAIAAGRLAEALAWLERAARDNPDDTTLLHDIAALLAATGQVSEAIDAAARLVARDPAPVHRLLLAQLQTRAGLYDLAEPALRALVDHPTLRAAARECLVITLADRGRLDEALAELDRAPRLESAAAFNQRGVVLERLGRTADALDAYHRAVGSDDELIEAWRNLALLYMRDDRADDAERALERYLRLAPSTSADRGVMMGRLERLRARP